MVETNKIACFKNHSFDREEISQVANCIGSSILQEVKEDLSANPFSLIVDNITVSGTNMFGMQARYLKPYKDSNGLLRHTIENKIIGLKFLKESSKAEILLEAIKDKLFKLSEEFKQNLFVGFAHDRAKTFTGEEKGLDILLQEEKGSFIFNVKDPCHSLNLVLKKSLSLLPQEIKFIEEISDHFSSLQRQAKLLAIQKEKGLKIVGVQKYIKTRWLSLGSTLSRILDICDSLIYYMKKKQNSSDKEKKYRDFLKLLEDKTFKLKLICLAGIINKKINKSNLVWQNQHLESQYLKSEMVQCIKSIFYLPNSQ